MPPTLSQGSSLLTGQPRAATESLSSTLVESSSGSSNHNSTSSSSEDSDSDSDSEQDEEQDTDSSDEDQDDHSELLKQLLIKAKQSAKQREIDQKEATAKKNKSGEDGLAENEEMVFFGNEDDDEEESSDEEDQEGTPKASTSKSISTLPPSLVRPLSLPTSYSTSTSLAKGKARAGPISLAQDLSGVLSNEGVTVVGKKGKVVQESEQNRQGEKWGMTPVARMSKKAYKASQPHTAGSKWFDMPATPMTPELKREIDAMRLRNALDPKKFMKGGAKKEKIGEFFQIGHVITPNSRATNNTSLPTASKRSFVEELVEDEQARAYAKRKTKEVMQKGMSGRKRQRKGGKGSYAMGQGGGKDGMGEAGGKRRKR